MRGIRIAILTAAVLSVSSASYAVNVQETVEMITHAELVMKDGSTSMQTSSK
jgi:hypothetical protein